MGGLLFEGPIRAEKYVSMISWGPIPNTHGMTMGEIAQFYNESLGIGCKLNVIKMQGWTRDMLWDDTGLVWVAPSTGIPHPLSAVLYSTNALIGGTTLNMSDGIGTAFPFELTAAPFEVNPFEMASQFNTLELPGVFFRPIFITPNGGPFKGQFIKGVQEMVTNLREYKPVHTALSLLVQLFRGPYASSLKIADEARFGRVWGNDDVLKMLKNPVNTVESIEATWKNERDIFATQRASALFYE